MKKIRQRKGWGVYTLNAKERDEYGFSYAVIHPGVMGTPGLTPSDSDWECNSEEECTSWIDNYEE